MKSGWNRSPWETTSSGRSSSSLLPSTPSLSQHVPRIVGRRPLKQVPASVAQDALDLVEPFVVVADARRVVAHMARAHAWRKGAAERSREREHVALDKSVVIGEPATEAEPGVSRDLMDCTSPRPTALVWSISHARPESNHRVTRSASERIAVFVPTPVVRVTPLPTVGWLLAPVNRARTIVHVEPPLRLGQGRGR